MKARLIVLMGIVAISLQCVGQSTLILQNPSDAPVGALGAPSDFHTDESRQSSGRATSASVPNAGSRLSIKDAEGIALKNNPAISVARLEALASQQVTREVRSNLWPQAYANLTGVDAYDDSRISAGGSLR